MLSRHIDILFIVPCPILDHFVCLTLPDRYLEKDGVQVGQRRARVAFENKLYILSHAVVVGVPDPFLTFVIFH